MYRDVYIPIFRTSIVCYYSCDLKLLGLSRFPPIVSRRGLRNRRAVSEYLLVVLELSKSEGLATLPYVMLPIQMMSEANYCPPGHTKYILGRRFEVPIIYLVNYQQQVR